MGLAPMFFFTNLLPMYPKGVVIKKYGAGVYNYRKICYICSGNRSIKSVAPVAKGRISPPYF